MVWRLRDPIGGVDLVRRRRLGCTKLLVERLGGTTSDALWNDNRLAEFAGVTSIRFELVTELRGAWLVSGAILFDWCFAFRLWSVWCLVKKNQGRPARCFMSTNLKSRSWNHLARVDKFEIQEKITRVGEMEHRWCLVWDGGERETPVLLMPKRWKGIGLVMGLG